MNDIEVVETLTEIISKQSDLIRQLHGIVKQLSATTTIDSEVALLLTEADRAVAKQNNPQ